MPYLIYERNTFWLWSHASYNHFFFQGLSLWGWNIHLQVQASPIWMIRCCRWGFLGGGLWDGKTHARNLLQMWKGRKGCRRRQRKRQAVEKAPADPKVIHRSREISVARYSIHYISTARVHVRQCDIMGWHWTKGALNKDWWSLVKQNWVTQAIIRAPNPNKDEDSSQALEVCDPSLNSITHSPSLASAQLVPACKCKLEIGLSQPGPCLWSLCWKAAVS